MKAESTYQQFTRIYRKKIKVAIKGKSMNMNGFI